MIKFPYTVLAVSIGLALIVPRWVVAKETSAVSQATPTPSRSEKITPVSTEPQQTSASFGDWVVRCERPTPTGKRICEAAQSLIIKGQQSPIAQIAFGHAPTDRGVEPALSLTVLLPVSIAFDKSPKLAGSDEASAAILTFRRCVLGGCIADGKPQSDFLKDLRSMQKPGRLSFTDAAERTIALPVSYRGLAQALDDLAKEAR